MRANKHMSPRMVCSDVASDCDPLVWVMTCSNIKWRSVIHHVYVSNLMFLCHLTDWDPGPFSMTMFNLNTSMDDNQMPSKLWVNYLFGHSDCTSEVWELISNSISSFRKDHTEVSKNNKILHLPNLLDAVFQTPPANCWPCYSGFKMWFLTLLYHCEWHFYGNNWLCMTISCALTIFCNQGASESPCKWHRSIVFGTLSHAATYFNSYDASLVSKVLKMVKQCFTKRLEMYPCDTIF